MLARTNTQRIGKRLVLTFLSVLMLGTSGVFISTLPAVAKSDRSTKSTETNYGMFWSQMSNNEKRNTIIDAVFDAVPNPAVATMLDAPGTNRLLKYFDSVYGVEDNALVPFKEVAAHYIRQTSRSTRE